MSENIIPVILCGGSGSRLWPLSRQSYPKQFWPLINNSKYSLLQNTYLRIKNIPNLKNPLIITNERYRFLVLEQMREINIEKLEIILEPEGRNTAPAIALAALHSISNSEQNPTLLIFSADHFIDEVKDFEITIQNCIKNMQDENIYIFGASPTKPEIGYGYIEIENPETSGVSNRTPIKVKRFVEKPKKEDAIKFLNSGNFLWNSGIFLFKSETIIDHIHKYSPQILKQCKDSLQIEQKDNYFIRPIGEHFLKSPNLSIDVAVLEKSASVYVFPFNVGWSDIGDWEKIWEISPKDENGNSSNGTGNVFLEKSNNSYIYSQNRFVVGIGVNDLIIIDNDDSLLIMDKNKNYLLKETVNTLKKRGQKESFSHNKQYRPWGSYQTINCGKKWLVKEIVVKPGEKLSLQSHLHRAEHWIVVNGTALVELDGVGQLVKENESVYIPLGSKHRLSNPGKIDINLIEVQTGSHLSEEDITRYDDVYGRKTIN